MRIAEWRDAEAIMDHLNFIGGSILMVDEGNRGEVITISVSVAFYCWMCVTQYGYGMMSVFEYLNRGTVLTKAVRIQWRAE